METKLSDIRRRAAYELADDAFEVFEGPDEADWRNEVPTSIKELWPAMALPERIGVYLAITLLKSEQSPNSSLATRIIATRISKDR